jgi:hypothetical protein
MMPCASSVSLNIFPAKGEKRRASAWRHGSGHTDIQKIDLHIPGRVWGSISNTEGRMGVKKGRRAAACVAENFKLPAHNRG